jgi:DNA processing protein
MSHNDTLYLHCLNLFPKFGPKRLRLLENYFDSFEAAFNASADELVSAGIDEALAAQFIGQRVNITASTESATLEHLGIRLVSYLDHAYPTLLSEIHSPPVLLYYRGTLPPRDAVMLAAVGTRKITTYGRSVIPQLLDPLLDTGLLIVSGMAFGVDADVARQAIAKGKPTVAVLGSGLDDKTLYPKAHALLAQEIIDNGGCIVSEYPPGTPGFKQNFVARNRIISGMCVGTLIIECDLKSGSLITAEFALEQNRRVYAVPGPIYARESRGPNNLIKMGAQLVTDSSDILQDLNITPQEPGVVLPPDTPAEATILAILQEGALAADEIVVRSKLDAASVTTTLTFLEIKGRVKNLGANQYLRIR